MPTDVQRYPLHQSLFYKLKNKRKLADLLRVTTKELRNLAKQADALYSEFSIKKKCGGQRGVENPARQLKLAQARIS